MTEKVIESDWKLFRALVPQWRERYIAKVNKELASVLLDQSVTSTEAFWKAKEKIDAEGRLLVNCLDGHSRSRMEMFLLAMLNSHLIETADVQQFSEPVRQRLSSWIERCASKGHRPAR